MVTLALTDGEKRILLQAARQAIGSALFQVEDVRPAGATPALYEPCGAFVTLEAPGPEGGLELRGCIGYVQASAPLLETVRRAARAAAYHDARFVPVSAGEIDALEIEISVLSPLEPVGDFERIRVGEHGLLVRRGLRSGLLLPQVASERCWSRETFLDHTCLKAGLEPGAWKEPGTSVEIFSALVFNERELGILGEV